MKIKTRKQARYIAVQAIYQCQFDTDTISSIEARFFAESNPKKIDLPYFSELLRGVQDNIATIDYEIALHSSRTVKEISNVEIAILRLATFELLFKFEIPYKVVINEALELAKIFGSEQGYKYVNGILDKVAKHVRVDAKSVVAG